MSRDSEPRREYSTASITVFWESRFCIHSGNCVRGLPGVFRPSERPWIHAEAASADEIARAVATCPTGALHFERLDGGPQEPAPETTTVRLVRNGPLYVRGPIEIRDGAGEVLRRDTRVALCRCGQSKNKPFCDNTHLGAGFRDSA